MGCTEKIWQYTETNGTKYAYSYKLEENGVMLGHGACIKSNYIRNKPPNNTKTIPVFY